MAVTLRDVAREAGVSEAAVSLVLRGHRAQKFSPATRRRIVEVARKMGYRANQAARALATGRSHLITFWTHRPYRPFYAGVLERVDRLAQQRGYKLLTADVSADEPGAGAAALARWPSDGLLAMDCGPWAERIARVRPRANTPVVSMGTALLPETDYVRLDLAAAFADAVRHLLGQDCRRIAYFSATPRPADTVLQSTFGAPREAYAAGMREAGLREEYVHVDVATRQRARQRIREYVGQRGCPDAFLCRNDDMAIGVYRALCDLGLEVGRDVLLVGCDGIEDTEFLHVPLSTIFLPVPRMCELAWDFLDRRLADPETPRQEAVLPAALEVRASSQRPRQRGRQRIRVG
jgi:LacI family transcriptional regulator